MVLHDQIILMCFCWQVWIYGSSYESFLVGVVNPNLDSLKHWAEENEVDGDVGTICRDARARAYILGELTKIGKDNKVCFHPSLVNILRFVLWMKILFFSLFAVEGI